MDACRHAVRDARTVISLATRPVLFALARALGEAWPGDVPRETLIARSGRSSSTNRIARGCESRSVGFAGCCELTGVSATARASAGAARAREVVVLARPSKKSTRRCSLPGRRRIVVELGPGPGTGDEPAQRAAGADSLAAAGTVQSIGRGRARRWMTLPVPIHDDLVTPGSAPERLGWRHESISGRDYPRVRSLSGYRLRAWRHVRRSARLVCCRREVARPRSSEREDAARNRHRRGCGNGSTASTSFRSPIVGSRRSNRRPAGCSPRSRRPTAAPGARGPRNPVGGAASEPEDSSDRP